jgi:hypothetical protein
MAELAQEENRALIKVCVDLGKTPAEKMKMMKDAYQLSYNYKQFLF